MMTDDNDSEIVDATKLMIVGQQLRDDEEAVTHFQVKISQNRSLLFEFLSSNEPIRIECVNVFSYNV